MLKQVGTSRRVLEKSGLDQVRRRSVKLGPAWVQRVAILGGGSLWVKYDCLLPGSSSSTSTLVFESTG